MTNLDQLKQEVSDITHEFDRKVADCYCRTCSREFKSLGIARHRAMHRDRKEVCTIVFNKTGMVITWDYRDKE